MQPMIRKIELAQQQERLIIDFMAVAQNHATRDYMRDCCKKFDDLHAEVVDALKVPVASCNPPRPTPPGIQIV